MITLYNTGAVIPCDTYYIRHTFDGLDELDFTVSIYDPIYKDIAEESILIEQGEQYIVKAIDGGTATANIKAQKDVTALKGRMWLNYTNGSATPFNTVGGVLPTGWACIDNTTISTKRTITFDEGVTSLDVITAVCNTWDITVAYSITNKTVTLINPANIQPMGAFASRDLNLKSVQYKGKSTELITRLYAYGKDGLSFASINGGKAYVDNFQYTDRIIVGYWADDRYTVASNLLTDAQTKLDELSKPDSSYECAIVDLAAANPEIYGFEDFSMHKKVNLIDDTRGTSVVHQVVEHIEYPYYPEKNTVTLSKAAQRISSTVKQLTASFTDPVADFYDAMQVAISKGTNLILNGTGGNVVFNTNADGRVYEILIMDTADISTAQDVWRWNSGGLAHSSTGYNGAYTTGIFQNGDINASMITTGTLIASLIKAGVLSSVDGQTFVLDLEQGELSMHNAQLTSTYSKTYQASDYSNADTTRINNILLGTITPTASDYAKYDFNGNGIIDLYDLVECRLIVLGVYGSTYTVTGRVYMTDDVDSLLKTTFAVNNGTESEGFRAFGQGYYAKNGYADKQFLKKGDSYVRTPVIELGDGYIYSGTTATSITFKTPFDSAPTVFLMFDYSAPTSLGRLYPSSITTAGFIANINGSSSSTAYHFSYIAIDMTT